MEKIKITLIILVSAAVLAGCSLVTKLKEKLIAAKDDVAKKESVKDISSGEDMNFYNKYTEAMNKIQESGEKVYSSYMSDIPSPGSLRKNSIIVNVSMQLAAGSLGNTVKEYRRSLLDGGELSKLKASENMQNDLERDLKNLLPAMDEYYTVASKVSEYYSKGEYRTDLTKAAPYEEELKNAYNNFKSSFDIFSSDLNKYKPKRVIYDPSEASNPDEKSSQIMLNAYGNVLDAAESFYESFKQVEFKKDQTDAKEKFTEFEKTFNESKNSVLSAEFSEKIKFMKYNFEDYFSSTVQSFLDAGKNFFDKAPGSGSETAFKSKYNDVINRYNNMIISYNSNIGTINLARSW